MHGAGNEAAVFMIASVLVGFCTLCCEAKGHLHLANLGNQATHTVKEKGQELFVLYRSTVLARGASRKRIAYSCVEGDLCGGLGDRLKGFASTFVLALLLDAEFIVEWTHPVPIEQFFKMPSAMNAATLRRSAKNATTWGLIDAHSDSRELNKLRKTDFKSLWNSNDFVSVHLNGAVWNHFVMNDHFLDTGDRYNLNKFSKRQLFEIVMKEYFSNAVPALKSYVLANFAKLNGVFKVGVQIRFGGQWGDGKRYNGDINTVTSCFVSETLRSCQASVCPRNCSVFFTTDQPEATPIFTNALEPHGITILITRGDTVHSEKSGGDQTQHMKAFGDWYLLTMMSRLVGSRSGFSETASWFGNIPSRALTKASTCLFYDEGVDIPDGAEFFSQE